MEPVALSYAEIGATGGPNLPAGYDHLRRTAALGAGAGCFRQATESLMTWQMHRHAGLRVSGPPRATTGALVRLGFGVGPLRLTAPCQVVYEVNEPRQVGFAYGTQSGHPESGEERFTIRWADDDTVLLTVTAFSRPATWYSRAAAPLTRHVQHRLTDRYLRALTELVSGRD
jgi:uncharacterized protein (UPF0548 family)